MLFHSLDAQTSLAKPALALAYGNLPIFNPQAWSDAAIRGAFPEFQNMENQQPLASFYDFYTWHRKSANCYLYALADLSLLANRGSGKSNIGYLSGDRRFDQTKGREEVFSATHIVATLEKDGLQATGDTPLLSPSSRPVALFVAENYDYHFLRLDRAPDASAFLWTHKEWDALPKVLCGGQGPHIPDIRSARFAAPENKAYVFVTYCSVPNDLVLSFKALSLYNEEPGGLALLPQERAALAEKGTKGLRILQLG